MRARNIEEAVGLMLILILVTTIIITLVLIGALFYKCVLPLFMGA